LPASPKDLEAEWAALAREDLTFFPAWATDGEWRDPPHLRLLAERLMDVEAGRIQRLIVTMPPRHGKSQLVTVHFPVWVLGRHPDWPILIASYGADLAYDFSRQARNEFAEIAPQLWGLDIADDSSAMGRWHIAGHRGGLIAAGVGGPVTGRGAQIALIDDPVKNHEDALSKTRRDAQWDWYRSTLRTRLHPGAAVILVMTRWNRDDLAGRLLAASESGDGEHWELLNLPAVAEENDALGRARGEPLWPDHYDAEALEGIRKSVGSYVWAALYQQHPQPDEGGLLKRQWWRFWREKPAAFDQLIQSWDMTFKDSAGSDFVVGQVWGRIGADRYLLDQVRARMDFPRTVQAVRRLSEAWPEAVTKLVEDKANGPAVIDTLKHEIGGLIAVEPEGSKLARAAAVSPQIEAGNVYLPDPEMPGYAWVRDFVDECTAFPHAEHDDQCFVAGTMIATLTGNVPIERVRAGDRVLTPLGLCRVTACGPTGIHPVVSRAGLEGTASHPVFGAGAFQPLASVMRASDISRLSWKELCRWGCRRSWSSRALRIDSWGRDAITSASRAPMPAGSVLRACTSLCGSLLVAGEFRQATRFITGMATRTTTTSVIWCAYRAGSIARSIGTRIGSLLSCSTSKQSAPSAPRGTVLRRGASGIASMALRWLRRDDRWSAPALNADAPSNLSDRRSTVRPGAAIGIGQRAASTPSPALASSVVKSSAASSPSTRPGLQSPAVGPAGRASRTAVVYNLTVDGAHVYYANGILVSNCDAMTQALRRFSLGGGWLGWLTEEAENGQEVTAVGRP